MHDRHPTDGNGPTSPGARRPLLWLLAGLVAVLLLGALIAPELLPFTGG